MVSDCATQTIYLFMIRGTFWFVQFDLQIQFWSFRLANNKYENREFPCWDYLLAITGNHLIFIFIVNIEQNGKTIIRTVYTIFLIHYENDVLNIICSYLGSFISLEKCEIYYKFKIFWSTVTVLVLQSSNNNNNYHFRIINSWPANLLFIHCSIRAWLENGKRIAFRDFIDIKLLSLTSVQSQLKINEKFVHRQRNNYRRNIKYLKLIFTPRKLFWKYGIITMPSLIKVNGLPTRMWFSPILNWNARYNFRFLLFASNEHD